MTTDYEIEGKIHGSRFKVTAGKRAKEQPSWPTVGENQTYIRNCQS